MSGMAESVPPYETNPSTTENDRRSPGCAVTVYEYMTVDLSVLLDGSSKRLASADRLSELLSMRLNLSPVVLTFPDIVS